MFFQSHYTRAQANSPRPVITSSGPSPKSSQGILASQQSCQSQQSLRPASQLHSSLSSSGREQKEQHSCRTFRRKSSDSSVPEEDKDKREETTGRSKDRRHCKYIYVVMSCIEPTRCHCCGVYDSISFDDEQGIKHKLVLAFSLCKHACIGYTVFWKYLLLKMYFL